MTEGYEALDMKCQMIVDDFCESRSLYEKVRGDRLQDHR